MSRHHTFLFTVDDKTVIDAAVGGNDARFLNHSCDPNCEAINDRKRIFIEATRNISAGEELLYDYQYERTDEHTEEDERFYACRCGSKCWGRSSHRRPKKRNVPPWPTGHDARLVDYAVFFRQQSLDAGCGRSLRIVSAVARRVDARQVRRSWSGSTSRPRVPSRRSEAAAKRGESVRSWARTRRRGRASAGSTAQKGR